MESVRGGSSMKTLIAVLAVAAVVTVQACTSTQTPSAEEGPAVGVVGEAGMVTVRGWIDAVDKTNRTVTLKGPRGGTVTLDVKDPTKLDTVAVGDPVVAAYLEALALKVRRVPGARPGASVQEARAEITSATVGREVVVIATITAVDGNAQ